MNVYSYSWSLDRLNQISIIPDFLIDYKDKEHVKIRTNVYVIDSGIKKTNDFYDNIYKNLNFIDHIEEDEIGHGSFVTSQISSKKYGVTKNVNITTIKVFSKHILSTSDHLISALKYTRDDCKKTKNNCVINLSLGLNQNDEIDYLLKEMHDENFLIIGAAGNSNRDCKYYTPSNLDFLFIVGSINYLNIKSSFSNYGNCVDIYTYGEMVIGVGLNGYTINSGTSMAAPIMTGYMANYWNLYPFLTNKQIQKKFMDDYSVKNYGYQMFTLKNSIKNDIIKIITLNIFLFIIFSIILIYN